MKNALIIFVRNPELGKVKTRIAALLGDEAALFIYQKLLNHTLEITTGLQADKFVFYADEIVEQDMWQRDGYFKLQQENADLGIRMKLAFEKIFLHGYEKVCIIGSDCYELSHEIIRESFKFLDEHDLVIGPAQDGGYYLLGMKTLYPSLFHNKSWSSGTVLTETLKNIQELKLSFCQLTRLSDIDEASDVPAAWLAY